MDFEVPKIKLTDKFGITVLVCLLLTKYGDMSEKEIIEITSFDDMISTLQLIDVLGDMTEKKLISISLRDNQNYYTVQSSGENLGKEFRSSLSVVLLSKVMNEADRLKELHTLQKSIRWYIKKLEKGYSFNVILLNEINESEVMNINIFSPTYENALEMQERFLEKPGRIVSKILDSFIVDNYLS